MQLIVKRGPSRLAECLTTSWEKKSRSPSAARPAGRSTDLLRYLTKGMNSPGPDFPQTLEPWYARTAEFHRTVALGDHIAAPEELFAPGRLSGVPRQLMRQSQMSVRSSATTRRWSILNRLS